MTNGNLTGFDVPVGATATLYVINTTGTVSKMPADHLLQPPLNGFETFPTCPSWAFLIESRDSKDIRRVVFDLGFPQNIESLPPVVSNRLQTSGFVFTVPKSTAQVLLEHGAELAGVNQGQGSFKLGDIEAIIWSHWHADHQGDIQHFPTSTALVVGPGFRDAFLPAYPDGLTSPVRKQDLDDRHLREISFDGPGVIQVAGFKAIDFFGDGSFYLLNTPGHAIGHIGGLVRTTTQPDTFALLGGDLSHHGGEIRPSRHLSLVSAARAVAEEDSEDQPRVLEVLQDMQQSRGRRNDQAFFDPCITCDFDEALQTIGQVQDADANVNVFFIGAHDDTLSGIVDMYPQTANDWQAKGWKAKSQWLFLRDFDQALRPERALKQGFQSGCP